MPNCSARQLELLLWEASSPDSSPKESTTLTTEAVKRQVKRLGVEPSRIAKCRVGGLTRIGDEAVFYHKGHNQWEMYRRDAS